MQRCKDAECGVVAKTRRYARLFCNYVGSFNANEKIYSRKNPANVNLIKLQGENMNNLTETHYSPLTIHHSLKKLTVI